MSKPFLFLPFYSHDIFRKPGSRALIQISEMRYLLVNACLYVPISRIVLGSNKMETKQKTARFIFYISGDATMYT